MDPEKISVYGDIIAIFGFSLLIYYMYKKGSKRTHIENALLIFGIGGFIVDVYLTAHRFL